MRDFVLLDLTQLYLGKINSQVSDKVIKLMVQIAVKKKNILPDFTALHDPYKFTLNTNLHGSSYVSSNLPPHLRDFVLLDLTELYLGKISGKVVKLKLEVAVK